MDKKVIAVLFGGQSSEHEVSCVSAATVIRNMDDEKYDKILIGITKDGRWLLVDSLESLENGSWKNGTVQAMLVPDTSVGLLIIRDGKAEACKVDVVYPVMHGLYGEDGTVQGILELSGIPYVGCGVLCSADSMDKLYTKIVVDTLDVNQAAYVPVMRRELTDMDAVIARIEAEREYPVFVKPSNAGSSKGVSKAHDRAELIEALKVAAAEDSKILVEETIIGRELECAILQDGREIKASGIGEVLAADEFYSFDAKYNNADSRTVIDPELPEGKAEEIRQAAIAIFNALDGRGMSRVDFFLEKETNRVVFNEINTCPGCTSISMYPMLWEAQGLSKPELIDRLIASAYQRDL